MLTWTSRMLGLFFIAFVSVFALDVFGQGYGKGELLLALFVHLIPSFLLVAALVVSWRKPDVGGAFFIALGVVSVFFFHTYRDFFSFGLITLPALIIGALFLLQCGQSGMTLFLQHKKK